MIVGTRGSKLALAQTKQVCSDLSKLTGEPIDVETLCAIISQRKDYKKGTKIRLIACYSGAAVDGVAKYMANKLHVIVLAPDNKAIVNRLVTGKTIVYSGSETGVHDGKFIPFTPDEVKKK